jgi:hypothetical protein
LRSFWQCLKPNRLQRQRVETVSKALRSWVQDYCRIQRTPET